MSPFDLTGPEFLALWFGGWVGMFLITLLVRALVARSRSAEDASSVVERLHPTELGYLIAGIRRAIEAAVAGLHHKGILEVEGEHIRATGKLGTVVKDDNVFRGIVTEEPRSRVEDYVLERSPSTIRELEVHADMLEAGLAGKLERDGLLVGQPWAARIVVALPGVTWLLFGIVKAMIGISRDRPVGILIVFTLLGTWFVWKFARVPRLTSLGKDASALARTRHLGLELTATTAPTQLTGTDMMLAYAVFGHTVAAAALLALMPSYHASLLAVTAGTGGSSSCSGGGCGSSCGGGCGGGCGGCG